MKFQFHLVRLKASIAVHPSIAGLAFQFHLVRLKAYDSCSEACCRLISIPFSTIKSAMPRYYRTKFFKFQFHLVRLKVGKDFSLCTTKIFQFHLVRLKVTFNIPSGATRRFQFHLVRLKDLQSEMPWNYQSISIPFSTIKSQKNQAEVTQLNIFQFHLVRLKGLCRTRSPFWF